MESKAQVRRRHRDKRAERDEHQTARQGHQLSRLLQGHIPAGRVVAGYIPMRGEPDVLPFLRSHLVTGGHVWVPVVADPQARLLHWARWDEQVPMRRSSPLPLLEPAGRRSTTDELITQTRTSGLSMLVPAVALDRSGGRLGHGGGFYDTLFGDYAELAQVAELIAVVHTDEVLDVGSFPVHSHDLRVPRAVTADGIIDLS